MLSMLKCPGRAAARNMAWRALSRTAAETPFPGSVGAALSGGELWSWGHSDDGNIREPRHLHTEAPVVQVSCGLFHSTAVTSDGKLLTWGRGEGGRLGNQIQEMDRNRGGIMPLFCPAPHPVDMEGVSVQAASAGGLHTLALTQEGQMFCFGFGRWGQLGLGVDSLAGVHTPHLIERLPPCRGMSAGGSHSAALSVKGALMTWGRPDNGRLGFRDSSRVNSLVPRHLALETLPVFAQVVCGGFQSAAYGAADGGLWMWGGGENGELGTGRQRSEVEPTAVRALAGERIVSVSIGGYHTACVTAGGDVLTWGRGTHGQLGLGPEAKGLPKCVAVSCGGTHTLALTASGDVMVFGANAQGQCGLSEAPYKVDTPLPLTGRLDGRRVLALAAGGSQSAAIVSSD